MARASSVLAVLMLASACSSTGAPVAQSSSPSASPVAFSTASPSGCQGTRVGYYDAAGYPLLVNQQCSPSDLAGFNTWKWTGTAWQLLIHGGSTPVPVSNMVYDPDLKMTVVLSGDGQEAILGYDPNLKVLLAHTHDGMTSMFDGVSWHAAGGSGPILSSGGEMLYDAAIGADLMIGDEGGGGSETWRWTEKAWTRVPASNNPAEYGVAFDASTNESVLLGPDRTMWKFDGSNWLKTSLRGPRLGGGATLVYDSARRELFYWMASASGSEVWAFRSGAWVHLAGSA